MATLNDIATAALRLGGHVPEAQDPTAFKIARAVDALSRYLDALPVMGAGGKLDEVSVTESLTVDAPARLLVAASSALTITLPLDPFDGYTVEIIDVEDNFATHNLTVARNGRKINGSAANATLSTNGQSVRYFYRADLGDWILWAAPYSKTDTVPLADDLALSLEYITSYLVGPVLGTSYSSDARSFIPEEADRAMRRIAARYGPKRRLRADRGLTRMPSQTHSWGNTSVNRR